MFFFYQLLHVNFRYVINYFGNKSVCKQFNIVKNQFEGMEKILIVTQIELT